MDTNLISGYCDERFLNVRQAFERNFEEGLELGASYAVLIGDEVVVDLWGGHADLALTKLWDKDTIAQVSSCSKIIVSLCGLLLVDRKLISLDEPVATYWPEFAQNGKEGLLVRQIFSHTSGLPGLDNMPGADVIGDANEAASRLASQRPWWEPGTKSGYQAMTYGLLIGELVRRTTGRTISQFFRDEIAEPLEIDFHLGLPESEWSRPAEIQENFQYPAGTNRSSTYYRAMGYMTEDQSLLSMMLRDGPWKMTNSSGNGVGNARSLARIGSLLAQGGTCQGRRFFSEETGKLPYQEQNYIFDKVMCAPVRWGLGFALSSKEIPLPFENAFHWGGGGGSSLIVVPEHQASWSYVPTNFSSGGAGDDPRAGRISSAVIKSLSKLGQS